MREVMEALSKINTTSRFDLSRIIEDAKNRKPSISSVKATQSNIITETIRDNFSNKDKYPDLSQVIKVGWLAIIPHGRRERFLPIISVGKRRITVKYTFCNSDGTKQHSFGTLRSHKFVGVVKNETYQ